MKVTSKIIPLRHKNIDTDQIIPARYLLEISKEGFGSGLFFDWRYHPDGTPKSEFVLNKPEYEGAEILVVGENFGSGSSREHAVWALQQFGIKVVVAPSFSDIFRANAYGNGLLLVEIAEEIIEEICDVAEQEPHHIFTIDLPNQKKILHDGRELSFEISPFVKEKIMKGHDNIGYILDREDAICAYEAEHQDYIGGLQTQ